jgi:hypothetical protein
MQSIEDLIDPIIEATNEGALRWKDEGGGSFLLKLDGYNIIGWSWVDENDGSSGITVQLRSAAPASEMLDGASASEFSPRYERLSKFLGVARRSALNVDKIIGDIKSDIEKIRKSK